MAAAELPAQRSRKRNRQLSLFRWPPRAADPPAAACQDCYAWGPLIARELCEGCRAWRRNHPRVGRCRTCHRTVALGPRGCCRLCWRQATAVRGIHGVLDLEGANRHGQQLFFADIFRKTSRRPARVPPAPQRRAPAITPVTWRQQLLFQTPRDLTRVPRSQMPEPRHAPMAAFLDEYITDYGAEHGWPAGAIQRARQGTRILLGLQDTPGAPLTTSEIARLADIGLAASPVRLALAETGMLHDDRTMAIYAWFDKTIAGLPEPMASEVRTWLHVMLHGSGTPPRFRPRHPSTIRTKLSWALPALQVWAAEGHTSLREITRQDVLDVMPASGTPRSTRGQGLRSLFSVLKARKVIFLNPAARISPGAPETRQPLPVDVEPLRRALNSTDAARAAIAGLVAFYALSAKEMTGLLLRDIRDGTLTIGDRVIPLAEPVRQRVTAWLDYRAGTWPATRNPYLLIHFRSALHDRPVRPDWITDKLGMSAQAIREDRLLHEAQATSGDTKALCELFGLSVQGAERYTQTVDHPAFSELASSAQP